MVGIFDMEAPWRAGEVSERERAARAEELRRASGESGLREQTERLERGDDLVRRVVEACGGHE